MAGRRSSTASKGGRKSGKQAARPPPGKYEQRKQERMRPVGAQQATARKFTFDLPPTNAPTSSETADAARPAQHDSGRQRSSGVAVLPPLARGAIDNSSKRLQTASGDRPIATSKTERSDQPFALAPLRSAMKGGRASAIVPAGGDSSLSIGGRGATSRGATSVRVISALEAMGSGENDMRSTIEDTFDFPTAGRGNAAGTSRAIIPHPLASTPARGTESRAALKSKMRSRPTRSVSPADHERRVASASPRATPSGVASPASRAAARSLQARQARHQPSPGKDAVTASVRSANKPAPGPRAAAPSKSAGLHNRRRAPKEAEEPRHSDEGEEASERPDIVRRSSFSRPALATAADRQATKKRLKRTISLALAVDADNESSGTRKSQTIALNDADVVWTVVGRDLKDAIRSQPSPQVVAALHALRTKVRSIFSQLSSRASERTRLMKALRESRKRKRERRREVFEARQDVLAVERKLKELESVRLQVQKTNERISSANAFINEITRHAVSWT